jgi:type I restriction enzyme S subunit
MGNISDGQLQLEDLRYLPVNHDEFPKLLLSPGDVLFNRTNSPELVGKTAVYNGQPSPCSFASYLLRIKLVGYESELLSGYINSSHGRSWVVSVVSQQVGQANVNSTKLKALRIPVPPINEQRRIVSKLESLRIRSRRAREALDAIPDLLEKFRQSVLAAAFRGDLTADWRAQHPDVEPASKLLERIRSERRRRWEETELEKMRIKGKVPNNDAWKSKYEAPDAIDTAHLPQLSQGWCWATLEELLDSLRNGIAAKPDQNSGLPILRISAVRPLAVDLEDVRYLPFSKDYDEYTLRNGDLLFTRYNGNAELVGSCAVVRNSSRMTVYPDKLIRGRVVEGSSLPDYIELALATGISRRFITEKSKTAAGQVGISGSDLRRTPVPVAPIEEQPALVATVQRLLQGQSTIAEQTRRSAVQLAQMEQVLLAKAFRGELVPQDPNDEPASVLLERIRAEREATAGSAPKRSRGRSSAA